MAGRSGSAYAAQIGTMAVTEEIDAMRTIGIAPLEMLMLPKGIALGEAALAFARDAGFRSMQFNAVVETNTVAVALWKKLGFEIVGTVPEAFDHPTHGPVGLRIMHRRL